MSSCKEEENKNLYIFKIGEQSKTQHLKNICFLCVVFLIFSFSFVARPLYAATLMLSGSLYSDEGVTLITAPKTINIAVGTSTVSLYATTSTATGAWDLTIPTGHSIGTSTPILVWVDATSSIRAALITKASSTNNITGLDLYKDHVIVSHEGTSGTSTTNATMSFYDADNDADIQFVSNADKLTVFANQELYIKTGKTFAPGGTVVASHIQNQGTFTASSSTLSLQGNFTNNGTFSHNDGTLGIGQDIVKYLAGRDASGSGTGTESAYIYTFATIGTTLYLGKWGNATACSQTAGSATGCELMVFDISSTTNPIYVAGRDVSGHSDGGVENADIRSLTTIGNYLYVGKAGNATACSQSAGSAIGCELMVYDVSSTTNPTYVAGRDVSGDSTGVGNLSIFALTTIGNFLYVGKSADATACSQTAGSAVGCELIAFDVSSPTNPVYVAGRDVSGDSTGTGSANVHSLLATGTSLYMGKSNNTTACSQTAGSAIGCELLVFDVSSTTNPVYVAGRDATGDSSGVGAAIFYALSSVGTTLYVTNSGSATACSQTAGSAIGCELLVFDVSSTTNPVYVAGRDASGNSSGTGYAYVFSLTSIGSTLYMGKWGSATACSQTAGSAIGCELMVFDISSTTNPVYLAGRDVSGNSTGTGSADIYALITVGSTLYMGKQGNATACSQTAGSAIGCGFMTFTNYSSTTLAGTFTGSSAFNNVTAYGNVAFANSASTSGLTIQSDATVVAPSIISLSGSYTNNGVFTHASGTVVMNSTQPQSLAGTMVGTSAFNQVTFSGSGTKTFSSNASTTNLSINTGATVVAPTSLTIKGSLRNYGTFDTVANSNALTMDPFTADVATYLAGRDASGSSAGTGNSSINTLAVIGTTLYLGRASNSTACSQTAGSAIGCELMVFDISSTTNPIYVAGRDASGDSAGTAGSAINYIMSIGSTLYVGKSGNATACSQTAGSAIGCELMVFDVSSTTNPIYVAGRDASGSSAGTGSSYIYSLSSLNSALYVGKWADATACSQTAGSANGCELMVFDISSTTNPIYTAGRDASGSSAGTGNVWIRSMSVIGSTLYAGKGNDATACSQTAGSAIGCELMVFDISSTTNPIYVAGRDASGSSAGTGNISMQNLVGNGAILYIGKGNDATACSQTAGSAIGCELMVFDVSSTTNPIYVAGRDASGDSSGTGSVYVYSLAIVGNILYVGKGSDATACSQTAGSAIGCELMVFDVSSMTNPIYAVGRDSSGSATGTGATYAYSFTSINSSVYLGKSGSVTACSQTEGSAIGCELMVFNASDLTGNLIGTLTGTSNLSTVTLKGTTIIRVQASTTNLTISSTATTSTEYPLSISGNYTNSGTFTTTADTFFTGASSQSLSGTMTGSSTFKNVYMSGAGTKTFSSNASTSDFIIASGSTVVASTNLMVGGTFTNSGTFTGASGTTTLFGNYTNQGTFTHNDGMAELKAYIGDYLAGRDASGDSTGVGNALIYSFVTIGNYLYVGKGGDATACSQTAGSAIGCELMVFDISSTTNPIYVAGRDASGDSTGIGNTSIYSMTAIGTFLYVGKYSDSTACSQTAGSAIGCELMVFDISSTTNPIYVAGRDSTGDATGIGSTYIYSIASIGSVLYVGKSGASTACSQTAGSAIGCELMVFDVSSTTNPIYVAGRDVSGNSTGTGAVAVSFIMTKNTTLYIGKTGSATACSQTAGSAIGCELMVFDISSTTNPIYVAGRDVSGDSTGIGNTSIYSINFSGTALYVGKSSSATACSQTAGSAIGCELMVFDISSTTNPIYIAGRDTSGDSTGIGNLNIFSSVVVGTTLYVGKGGDATACSQTAGSAIGCELMVFDISSTTNPIYVAGRDASGDSTGVGNALIYSFVTIGNYLYVGKGGDATACSQTAGSAIGCELMVFNSGGSYSGTMTGSSAFKNISVAKNSTFLASASTTNLTIQSGATLVAPAASNTLSIAGNYTNSGTFTHASGTIVMNGTSAQAATGTLTGTSAFNTLAFAGASTKTLSTNASTTNLTIDSGATVVPPAEFSIAGNFTQNGTLMKYGGIVWSTSTSASDSDWVSVTYGNGLFVAVAMGAVMTSPDGVTWTSRTAASGNSWYSVTYGNGLFVAVAYTATGDSVMTSPDGITWTSRTSAASNLWTGVTYGNGLFVAVSLDGTGNRVMTSPDGITWTSRTSAANNSWRSVTYGNGLFVAVSGEGPVMTSPDGITWTLRTAAVNNYWINVTYGNGLFVAVSISGTGDRVMTSPDGITWTSRSSVADNAWSSVTYGNGLFVAVACGVNSTGCNATAGNRVMTSPDGITWTSRASSASNAWYSVVTSDGTFVAVANTGTGNRAMISSLGTTTFNGTSAQTLSGTMVATSSLGYVYFTGAGTKTFSSNASTSNFVVSAGATVVAPTLLSIMGNYTNSGTFTANSSTVLMDGRGVQTATGTMTGASSFANLTLANSGTNGSTTQAVTFGAPISTTATFKMLPGTSALMNSATNTLTSINLGGVVNQYVWLRSIASGTPWALDLTGAQEQVSYVNVKDSNACDGSTVDAIDGTNIDAGGNTCWSFVNTTPNLSSAANQTFAYAQGTTTISAITLTDATTSAITAANDIRIKIATSTISMFWDTTDVTATITGTASGKVSTTVSYEGGGSVLVIPVNSDFASSDTIVISDLSFTTFGASLTATSVLSVYTGGVDDITSDDSDDKTVAISSALIMADHTEGQVSDSFAATTITATPLFAFHLTPGGEDMSITSFVFPLRGVVGIAQDELTNTILYRDTNSDGVIDGGDPAVGGTGVVSISGQTGTITFSATTSATTTGDYILVGDISNIKVLDSINMSLGIDDLVTVGATFELVQETGSITSVQHMKGGAGAGASGGAVGGNAPAGQGVTTGGGSGGGDEIDPNSGDTIGNDPGFNAPSSNGTPQGQWAGGGDAYVSDSGYTTSILSGNRHSYGTFGFAVPSNNTITGIAVKMEAQQYLFTDLEGGEDGSIDVKLSWDGGSSLTSLKNTGVTTIGFDSIYTLGGPSDTWGHSWTPTELNSGNFTIEIISHIGGHPIYLDAIQVRVYHQATGGGGGGGGAVWKHGDQYFANVYSAVNGVGNFWMRIFNSLLDLFTW